MNKQPTRHGRQALVRYSGKEETARLYEWLDGNGYRNIQHLSPDSYIFPVVCVNESGEYFGTNVTCMAAAASCGIRPIDAEEFFVRGFGS